MIATQQQQDLHYLNLAFKLAQIGEYTTSPNPAVGCILVKDECIIGQGWHQCCGENHAEVNALLDVKKNGFHSAEATVYVTLEPCNHTGKTPPCTEALIKAKVKRVVIALVDVDERTAGLGIKKLEEHGIVVDTQTANNTDIQHKVRHLCRGYLSRQQKKRPHTTLKIATSLDGKVALHNGKSKWITSEEARQDAQLLRRQADVILTTSSTIRIDNPHFTVRLSPQQEKQLNIAALNNLAQPLPQPTLAILNSDLSLELHDTLNILKCEREIWIFHAQQCAQKSITAFNNQLDALKKTCNFPAKVSLVPVPTVDTNTKFLNISAVFYYLGKRLVNNVLIEAGAQLNGSLIEAHHKLKASQHSPTHSSSSLIDEWVYYINSKVMGRASIDAFNTSVISEMQNTYSLSIDSVKALSAHDIKLIMH